MKLVAGKTTPPINLLPIHDCQGFYGVRLLSFLRFVNGGFLQRDLLGQQTTYPIQAILTSKSLYDVFFKLTKISLSNLPV